MKSKIISIGDEILIGQVVNTNAAYLGDRLFSIGMPDEKTVVIGDEENILLDELKDSLENYDVTVITGGLGPTHDDITKPVLIKFFKDRLVLDKKVLRHVKNIFSSRNLRMPEVNTGQAMVPENSIVIRNANGTAPGLIIEKNKKLFVAMPGVPYEMKPMFEYEIIPFIRKYFSNKLKTFYQQKTLLTTGIGESALQEMLGDINELLGDSKLAFLPSSTGVRLRINVEGKNKKDAVLKLNLIEKKIRSKAEEFIFGVNDDLLERIIGGLLRKKKKTLSVAESCTGGMITSRIVSIPGSSDYFIGGICAYSNEMKTKLLKVKKETIINYGAVSRQTAIEMAEGAREVMKTDYAISATGIAGPKGGTKEKPVGLVWIGYSSKNKKYAKDFMFGEDRGRNIERAAQRSLEILRKELMSQ